MEGTAPPPKKGTKRSMSPERSRLVLTFIATAAAGFLLAYLVVAFIVLPDAPGVGDVTVPGVVGLTHDDARRRLVSAGLVAAVGEERFSPDAPKSTVITQTPAAGSSVARGTQVTLDISAGQQRSLIPSLVGLSQGDAERAIRKAGLAIGQVREARSDSARGIVLESRPNGGETVPAETRVDLVVSAGPDELVMPDVVGRDEESATALLRQLGFTVAPPEHDPFAALPAGTVVSQSPAAGTAVAGTTTVTLKISARP